MFGEHDPTDPCQLSNHRDNPSPRIVAAGQVYMKDVRLFLPENSMEIEKILYCRFLAESVAAECDIRSLEPVLELIDSLRSFPQKDDGIKEFSSQGFRQEKNIFLGSSKVGRV